MRKIAFGFLILLAACGGNSPLPTTSTESPSVAASAAPQAAAPLPTPSPEAQKVVGIPDERPYRLKNVSRVTAVIWAAVFKGYIVEEEVLFGEPRRFEIPPGKTIDISYTLPKCGPWQIDVSYSRRTDAMYASGDLIASDKSGPDGTVACGPRPSPTPTPTPKPTCEQLHAPAWTLPNPSGDVDGSATVENQGTWRLTLYATSSIAEYNGDDPDFTKDNAEVTLLCGQTATLAVHYNWVGHNSKYWWTVLRLDGSVVAKSDARVNH